MKKYFKTIIGVENFVEGKIGEEVNKFQELSNDTYKFISDNFEVEVVVKENLYDGFEILSFDIEKK